MNFIHRRTALSANIVAFCRYLRGQGLPIGVAEEADALNAMTRISFRHPEILRQTLRAVLTKSLADQARFDKLYFDYWNELTRAVDSKIAPGEPEASEKNAPDLNQKSPPSIQSLKNWLHGNNSKEVEELSSYSAAETLTTKDFSAFSEDELHEVMKLITVIAKSMATKYSRRYRHSQARGALDMRRTLRLSMRHGGEIIDLAFRRRKILRLKLLIFCDVSKSMDLYTQFLIQFIYAFQNVTSRIETFVFSTSLHRISEQLQKGAYKEALQELSRTIPDWSGGTKIGMSLRTFVDEYGSKLLDDRTIVLMMSDGWDTGDLDILEESMREIYRKSGRIIWLNPLAGSPEYEPTVRGMQTALPFVDIFAPVHNIESLKQLLNHVQQAQNGIQRRKRRRFTYRDMTGDTQRGYAATKRLL
ncbi:MAG: VWA domain-containing protein [bacterium]